MSPCTSNRVVIPGLVPGTHTHGRIRQNTDLGVYGMAGTSPAMTIKEAVWKEPLAVGPDDRFADQLAVGQGVEGGAPVGQGVFGVHARADLALFGELPDGGVVLRPLLRELAAVFAGADADHRETLDERDVDRQHGQAAGGEADGEDAAAEGDAAEALVGDVAAHGIVDHVGALAAGEALDPLAEAPGDVDRGLGCVFAGNDRELRVAGRAPDPLASPHL